MKNLLCYNFLIFYSILIYDMSNKIVFVFETIDEKLPSNIFYTL
jgi:hypothetical protein